MGGQHGHGPIAPEADEPPFHAPWEARALALTLAAGAWGRWNIDVSRHARERIAAAEYLRMSYYEKWITGLEELLVTTGLVSAEELASGRPAAGAAKATPPLTAEVVPQMLARGGSYRRETATAPRFAVGDAVSARDLNPVGHTRLPRYVRGRRGVVAGCHGAHVFPDSHAHGLGQEPRHLYQVRFEATELWGQGGFAGAVHLDLWEPYLDPG
jgi:nitrile hydratase